MALRPRSDLKRKLIGLFLIFCGESFQWEEKGMKWFLWRTIPADELSSQTQGKSPDRAQMNGE